VPPTLHAVPGRLRWRASPRLLRLSCQTMSKRLTMRT